jgi:hypothetical protein
VALRHCQARVGITSYKYAKPRISSASCHQFAGSFACRWLYRAENFRASLHGQTNIPDNCSLVLIRLPVQFNYVTLVRFMDFYMQDLKAYARWEMLQLHLMLTFLKCVGFADWIAVDQDMRTGLGSLSMWTEFMRLRSWTEFVRLLVGTAGNITINPRSLSYCVVFAIFKLQPVLHGIRCCRLEEYRPHFLPFDERASQGHKQFVHRSYKFCFLRESLCIKTIYEERAPKIISCINTNAYISERIVLYISLFCPCS